MSLKEEVEGLTSEQAIRHLALSIDKITNDLTHEVAQVRKLLTTVSLLFAGTLIGVTVDVLMSVTR